MSSFLEAIYPLSRRKEMQLSVPGIMLLPRRDHVEKRDPSRGWGKEIDAEVFLFKTLFCRSSIRPSSAPEHRDARDRRSLFWRFLQARLDF